MNSRVGEWPSVEVSEEEVVRVAEDLIRIPSQTEDEREAVEYVKRFFDEHGIEYVLQEVSPGRPQIVGIIPGRSGGPSLMFNGHLDNDSVTASWEWDPFIPKREGNRLWGHGVHNMKSGVAAMLAAAAVVRRSGVPLNGDLVIACVVGELQGGKGTIHLLNSGVRTDMAIVPEPYSIDRIITKCVGVQKVSVTTFGRSIHTSRREYGVDAIAKMLKAIPLLKELKFGPGDPDLPDLPRLNLASIIGGRGREYDLAGPSNLADLCTIIIDVRYADGISTAEIDQQFVDCLNRIKADDPEFEFEFRHPPDSRFKVGGADMPPTNVPSDAKVVQIIQAASKTVLGREIREVGVVLPYSYCGNDTAHLQRAGISCCLYGPRGYDDSTEMHVRVDEMVGCSRVLAACALHICGST